MWANRGNIKYMIGAKIGNTTRWLRESGSGTRLAKFKCDLRQNLSAPQFPHLYNGQNKPRRQHMQSAYTSGWHTVSPMWIVAILNKIRKCSKLGSTMKKVIIICNKTFLRGPAQLTMIWLSFSPLGSGHQQSDLYSLAGTLAVVAPGPSWANQVLPLELSQTDLVWSQLVSWMATFCHAEET